MTPIQAAVSLCALISILGCSSIASAENYSLKPSYAQPIDRPQINPIAIEVNLFHRGMKKQNLEDYPGAISDYTEFLKTNPTHLLAYSNRGYAKAMQNDLIGSMADLNRAIELAPSADTYNARGNVKAMAGNKIGSVRDFNRAIRLDRNFADAYYNRAISRHDLGDIHGAKSDFAKAAQLFHRQQDLGGYQQSREWLDRLN